MECRNRCCSDSGIAASTPPPPHGGAVRRAGFGAGSAAGVGGRVRRVLSGLALAAVVVAGIGPGVSWAQAGDGDDEGRHDGFDDVVSGVHAPAVDALAQLGVFEGTECGEGLFCPGEAVRRWVMAVWLVRVLEAPLPEAGASRFSDVDPGVWWSRHVEALADLEVTTGCSTEGAARYCPDGEVSRAQMASFMARAFDLEPSGDGGGFSDVTGGVHAANIDALAETGITVGCAVDPARYCPARATTRAQMATFLNRARTRFMGAGDGDDEGRHDGFGDVVSGVHASAVDALARLGVFEGTECGEGLFCPGEPVRRWVMAVWLVRVVGAPLPDAGGSRFVDVDPGVWWSRHVEALADLGITEGCASQPARYCPDGEVSRAQMASFMARAFSLEPSGDGGGFSDVSGGVHAANIDALAASGITKGCADDPARYCPTRATTRAQMASFLKRARTKFIGPCPNETTDTGGGGSGPGGGPGPTGGGPGPDAVAPRAPRGVMVAPGDGELTVSWSAPSELAGVSSVTYVMEWRSEAQSFGGGRRLSDVPEESATIGGLENGTTYAVRVSAVVSGRRGRWSAPMSAVPGRVRDAPRDLVVETGDRELMLRWEPPGDPGGSAPESYVVQWAVEGESYSEDRLLEVTETSATIPELANGALYRVRVVAVPRAAVSFVGPELWAEATGVPAVAPGAPHSLMVAAGDQQLMLSWESGESGGLPVIEHRVQWRSGGQAFSEDRQLVTGGDTAAAITGLVNGALYRVRVAAASDAGISDWSTASGRPATRPGAPGNLDAVRDDRSLVLSWDRPADDGGAVSLSYVVQWRSGGQSFSAARELEAAGTPATVPDLVNGTAYWVRVAAVNDDTDPGRGAWSEPVEGTPATVPDPPRSVSTTRGDRSLDVTWAAPAESGGAEIEHYVVQWRSDGQGFNAARELDGPGTSATITGLVNGVRYWVRVAAVNEVGTGATSEPVEGTPATRPGPPQSVSATRGDGSLDVIWAEPAESGGLPVTGYRVQWRSGDQSFSAARELEAAGNSATVPGLASGTAYWVRVAAVTEVGAGAWSAEATDTPASLPDPPRNVTAASGDRSLALSWDPPAETGGSEIERYVIQWKAGGDYSTARQRSATSASATVSGLANGTEYTVRVAAVTANGAGTWSAEAVGTAATEPSAPRNLTVVGADRALTATWTAPASTGGLAVERYLIQWTTDPSDYGSADEREVRDRLTVTLRLANGTEFWVRVAAVNEVGAGAWSTQKSDTPATWPGPPVIDGLVAEDRRLVVRWTPPADDGGGDITSYRVRWRTHRGSYNTADIHRGIGPSASSDTIEGLERNTRYRVQVVAVNKAGPGAWSTAASAKTPMTAPEAPRDLEVTRGDGELELSWEQPHDTGGAHPLTYVVQWRSGDEQYDTSRQKTTTSTSATIAGLDNGTRYWVQVSATNDAGSTPGVERDGTPLGAPGLPGMVEFEGDPVERGRLVLSWAAPGDDGGTAVTGYWVRWRVHGEREHKKARLGAASRSHRIGGPDLGTRYWAQVAAVNRIGVGPWSDVVSAVPLSVPREPREVAAEARDRGLRVTWQASADDGSDPVTAYEIRWRTASGAFGAAVEVGAAVRLHEITGLYNDTGYVVRVRAVNSQGAGAAAEVAATPRPPAVPGPPREVAAQARDRGLRLTWTSPSSDGRTPVTAYEIQWRTAPGAFGAADEVDAGMRLHEITGLDNDTGYVVRVRAVNSQGAGTAADVGATPRPPTVPGPPIIAAVVPLERGVTVEWRPPPNDGRAPVSSYRLGWPGGGTEITGLSDLSHDIVGLDFGRDSVIRVSAVNSVGEGTPAAVAARSNQVPGPPRQVRITEDDASLVVWWGPPAISVHFAASYSGSVVTEYVVQWKTSGQQYGTDRQATVAPGSVPDDTLEAYTITGLDNGSDYSVRVIAVNEGREGPPGEASGRPRQASPGAPPLVTAYNRDSWNRIRLESASAPVMRVRVEWAPALRDGLPADDYHVQWEPADQGDGPSGRQRISARLDHLILIDDIDAEVSGTEYRVRVRATYGDGHGPWTETRITVANTPGEMSQITATPGDGSALVEWDPPSDGGSPITAYLVSWADTSVIATGESYEITGLENGRRYTVRVVAINNVGVARFILSVGYPSVKVTPDGPTGGPGAPGVPGGVVVVPGDGSLSVSWAAPADDGGAAVSAYEVSWEAAGQPGTAQQADAGASSSHVVTGLANGTDYVVEVAAANSAGTGPAAALTAAPAAAGARPGAPGGIVVVPGDGMLLVSWAEATDSTGTAASRYEVGWEAAGQPGTARQADAGAALSHVVTGLVNGTAYVVEVAAANSAGTGPATVTQAVPTGLPGAPQSLVAARSTTVLGRTRMLVDWLPPDNDGGSGIIAYRVSWRADGERYDESRCSHRRADTAGTSHPIGELGAGTTYHVRVVAVNVSGAGPATEITVPPQNAAGS